MLTNSTVSLFTRLAIIAADSMVVTATWVTTYNQTKSAGQRQAKLRSLSITMFRDGKRNFVLSPLATPIEETQVACIFCKFPFRSRSNPAHITHIFKCPSFPEYSSTSG